MKLATALSMLRTQPLAFLRNNLLSIAGSSPSGVKPYYFGYYSGIPVGVNEAFRFSPMIYDLDQQQTGDDGINRKMMPVHCLEMNANTADFDISAIPAYTLDGGGPDIMVTGQLSACIIVVQQMGGQLRVGHIQPGGTRQTGSMLRTTLKLMGRFAGGGRITHVFGLGDYNPRAYLVGVRTAGVWHLYAQIVSSAKGPVTNSVQIL